MAFHLTNLVVLIGLFVLVGGCALLASKFLSKSNMHTPPDRTKR